MSATRVVPIYSCEDLEQTVAWYRDVFGAKIGETFEQDGNMVGAEVKYGAVRIWLGQDDFEKGRNRPKGEGFRIVLETDQNIDELAAGIKERGGVLLMEPKDEEWGVRMFALADPDGFKISISTPVEQA